MHALSKILVVISAFSAFGCAKAPPVVTASDITLDSAMTQVAESLSNLKKFETANNLTIGVIVDEVDLNFQLAANASQTNKLTLAIAAPSGAPVGGSIGTSNEGTVSTARGSTIQVKMKSLGTADLNLVGCYFFLKDYSSEIAKACANAKPAAGKSDSGTAQHPAPPRDAPSTQKHGASNELGDRAHAAASFMQRQLDMRNTGFVVSEVSTNSAE